LGRPNAFANGGNGSERLSEHCATVDIETPITLRVPSNGTRERVPVPVRERAQQCVRPLELFQETFGKLSTAALAVIPGGIQ
jgi:hypothetical protein